jgi:hypothetical protein
VVKWSEFLTTDHEVPGSIPGSASGIFFFLEGEDPPGDYGLGRLVEFRFKTPPGTSYSFIHLIGTAPHGRPNLSSRLHFHKGHVVALGRKKNEDFLLRPKRMTCCYAVNCSCV